MTVQHAVQPPHSRPACDWAICSACRRRRFSFCFLKRSFDRAGDAIATPSPGPSYRAPDLSAARLGPGQEQRPLAAVARQGRRALELGTSLREPAELEQEVTADARQ